MTESISSLEKYRTHIIECYPLGALPVLPTREFHNIFKERSIFRSRDVQEMVERTQHLLYCRKCEIEEKFGDITAHRLHTTYEEDPLRNYPSMLHTRCYGCSDVMQIPLPYEPPAFVSFDNVRKQLGERHPVVAKLAKHITPRMWRAGQPMDDDGRQYIAQVVVDDLLEAHKAEEDARIQQQRAVLNNQLTNLAASQLAQQIDTDVLDAMAREAGERLKHLAMSNVYQQGIGNAMQGISEPPQPVGNTLDRIRRKYGV